MSTRPTAPPPGEPAIAADRRARLAELREQGIAFPNRFPHRDLAGNLIERYEDSDRDSLDLNPVVVTLGGRLMSRRHEGKASFALLQDVSGAIQLYLTDSYPGKERHRAFRQYDPGDIIGAGGVLFKTQTGELTVRVKTLRLLVKALRPLPHAGHSATGQERYRRRYLDLMVNEDTRLTFVLRARIVQAMRQFFVKRRYLEVETPMLQPLPGATASPPFATHHNALDMELYLRSTPGLYLRRLVVAGCERVFELNRSFRNEGACARDNSECTTLEFCVAYRTHEYLMVLLQQVLSNVAAVVFGVRRIVCLGREIDLEQPFAQLTLTDAIRRQHPGVADATLNDRAALFGKLQELGIGCSEADSLGALQLAIFENTAAPGLFEPVYITDYPVDVAALARRSDTRPGCAERFGLFIAGHEVASGYSQLNDPEDQAARLREQAHAAHRGGAAAIPYDADFVRALEYGMPPGAGASLAVDRLVMLFTGSPGIRDVILFPQLGPE